MLIVSKLISFKDRINKEQAAFEKAEQERIEQAMEVAAQEDLNNRTSAVSVETLDVYVDEYGVCKDIQSLLTKKSPPFGEDFTSNTFGDPTITISCNEIIYSP